MIYQFGNSPHYSLSVEVGRHGVSVVGGTFRDITLLPAPLFSVRIKNISDNSSVTVDSSDRWDRVLMKEHKNDREWVFDMPCGISDIAVFLYAHFRESGIEWTQQVVNNNSEYSVMEITYPTPKMTAERFSLFVPQNSGFVVEDAGKNPIFEESYYPGWKISMQYFALYGKTGGIYIAAEDGKAATKQFRCKTQNDLCELNITFPAIAAGRAANSFEPFGKCRWSSFEGDWYDATLLYSDFVHKEANWLPEIDENGRPDTPERFKEVPFWVSDYIPNTPYQRDNKPMNLSAGSDVYSKDYWYQAPIALQKELGVPIAYHVYNWHEIPFNIEYPHFMPAKKEFKEHIAELQDNSVYVLPYINAVSWEMHDDEGEHDITFKNTGCRLGALQEDGSYGMGLYPQTTKSGETAQLVQICGSCGKWHKMMEELTRKMEKELSIDGVYFDEISAARAFPCFNPEHNHLPGGGSYRVDGFKSMMKKIGIDKPKDNFYFSECNAEPYMKSFDGFLTWMWVTAGEVPAYTVLYGGYIQMIGRCTIGNKKDDFEFFKYCTAKSVLYGQQLGWCKADIVYSPKHMEFLKNAVGVRCACNKIFQRSRMLRPPVVTSDLPKLITKAGLWFSGDIVSEQVIGTVWKQRNGEKCYIILANLSEQTANYRCTFRADEYGLKEENLPKEFSLENGIGTFNGSLRKYEIKVLEIPCN